MASEVKTNKISPSTSTTVTLGDASDTFVIPASATLDVNGTIDITGATATGFPSAGFAGVHADVTSGSSTYTVPADITKLLVIITGGGGSGASGTTAVGAGGGGCSAGTVMARVTVVATDTITIAIGAGGVQTADASGTIGNVGGDSTFTHASGSGSFDTITAPGGRAGPLINTVAVAPVAPTVGASNEGIAIKGGYNAIHNGSASFWGQGGATGVHVSAVSTVGEAFGSGGGSGTYSAGRFYGSAGADGVCFIMEFK
jgi:hypothetical protein